MSPRSSLALAFTLAGGLALWTGPAFAALWPLSPPKLAANFGSFAKGRVSVGIALASSPAIDGAGGEVPARAAEDGEIAFSAEEGAMPSGLPSALGSFMVLEQRGGMAAVYSHLAPGSLQTRERKHKSGDEIARPGRSGWIEGPGLVYQVFDRRSASWVNPYLILPPLADATPPAIRSLALAGGSKSYAIGSSSTVPQGTYGISVEVSDPSEAPWSAGALAPYLVRLSVDGVQIAEEVFDVAKAKGGKLLFFAQSPIAAVDLRTAEGRYELAERLFSRGRSVIEVQVEDAAGNRRSASWAVLVE